MCQQAQVPFRTTFLSLNLAVIGIAADLSLHAADRTMFASGDR